MEQVPYSPTDYVALFFDLFEASSDAVYITRVGDGVVFDANDSALSLFGYTRAEAIGHSTLELGLWANPKDRQTFIEAMHTEGRLRRYAIRLRTKWSEEFTLELSATPEQLRGEDVILGVGVLPRSA